MRVAVQRFVASGGVLAVAAASSGASSTADLDAVVERVHAYVETYEETLGSIVMDEHYVQELVRHAADGPERLGTPPVERRSLRAEFLLVRVPGSDGEWFGFRDVHDVDGRPVPNRRSAADLVRGAPDAVRDLARTYVAESARYNLGDLTRNLNVPTFGLVVLRRAHHERMSFAKRAEVQIAGRTFWELAIRERSGPTIVRTPAGGRVPLRVVALVDPSTGDVLRVSLTTDSLGVTATIVVRFERDDRLGVRVPVAMTERYDVAARGDRPEQRVRCEATYTNFRRFGVSARVIGGRELFPEMS